MVRSERLLNKQPVCSVRNGQFRNTGCCSYDLMSVRGSEGPCDLPRPPPYGKSRAMLRHDVFEERAERPFAGNSLQLKAVCIRSRRLATFAIAWPMGSIGATGAASGAARGSSLSLLAWAITVDARCRAAGRSRLC